MRNEIIGLKHEPDAVIAICVPILIGIIFCGFTFDDEIARSVSVQTADDVQKRSFSAPRRTDHRDEFVAAEIDAHPFERGDLVFAFAVIFDDIFQTKHKINLRNLP